MSRRSTKRLPPIFGTADLAEVLGWRTERVRRWCEKKGLIEKSPDGERRRVDLTYGLLLDKAPDVYYALLSAGVIDGSPCDDAVAETQ